MKIFIIELVLLGSVLFPTFSAEALQAPISEPVSQKVELATTTTEPPLKPDFCQIRGYKGVVAEFIGEVSAYNLGDRWQNDDSPCIGAFNENLCEAQDLVVANNYYRQGTIACIEGVGCARVADRMNARYGKKNFDIAMRLDEKKKAKEFGRRNLKIIICKK